MFTALPAVNTSRHRQKMPLRIQEEADGPVVATDYTAVYEHIRDAHPDQWTEELAAGFESSRGGSRH